MIFTVLVEFKTSVSDQKSILSAEDLSDEDDENNHKGQNGENIHVITHC